MENQTIQINEEYKGERIDKVLVNFIDKSRTQIAELIKEGYVLVNDKEIKSNYKVELGDIITMGDRLAKGEDIHAENIRNQRDITPPHRRI